MERVHRRLSDLQEFSLQNFWNHETVKFRKFRNLREQRFEYLRFSRSWNFWDFRVLRSQILRNRESFDFLEQGNSTILESFPNLLLFYYISFILLPNVCLIFQKVLTFQGKLVFERNMRYYRNSEPRFSKNFLLQSTVQRSLKPEPLNM